MVKPANPVLISWYTNYTKPQPASFSSLTTARSVFCVLMWPCHPSVDFRWNRNTVDLVHTGLASCTRKFINLFISAERIWIICVFVMLVYADKHITVNRHNDARLGCTVSLLSVHWKSGMSNCCLIALMNKKSLWKSLTDISIQMLRLHPRNLDECLYFVYIRDCGGSCFWKALGRHDPGQNLLTINETDNRHIAGQYSA